MEVSQLIDILNCFEISKNNLIIILKTNDEIEEASKNLKFFNRSIKIVKHIEWDCPAYDNFGPSRVNRSKRIINLVKLNKYIKHNIKFILLTSHRSFIQKVQDLSIYQERILKINDEISYKDFQNHLENIGYEKVDNVIEYGTYANRGGIIDLFSPNYLYPIRLDFFGNKIDSIRFFDIQNQLTIKNVNECKFYPFSEIFLNSQTLKNFQKNYIYHFKRNDKDTNYEDITTGIRINGIEQYLPLFYDDLRKLTNIVPNSRVIKNDFIIEELALLIDEITDIYNLKLNISNNDDLIKNLIKPIPIDDLYLNIDNIEEIFKNQAQIDKDIDQENIKNKHIKFYNITSSNDYLVSLMGLSEYSAKITKLSNIIDEYIDLNKSIIFTTDNLNSTKNFLNELNPKTSNIKIVENILDAGKEKIYLTNKIDIGHIEINDQLFISFDKLFNIRKNNKSTKSKKPTNYIKELTSINVGDYVVHREYGIGKFNSLKKINTKDMTFDCLELIYKNNDKVHIPVENIELLSLYSHSNNDQIELDKLGSAQWQVRKNKAANNIKEIAAELIKQEAKRKLSSAINFETDYRYNEFVSFFEFEETEDQLKAERDILDDLSKGVPMDRLICGDVGFGKTELALRASYLIASNHYQVVILAPTTILAKQHYENFQNRFKNFALTISCISRFTSKAERLDILNKTNSGEIDILIGTHSVLNDELKFKKLAMIVIDEEQNFGVKQKEYLKKHADNIHILSLSATPIPRSMQLALNGIRDMSIIMTPPEGRLPIKTSINYFEPSIVRKALLSEKNRNGQSFIICPKIKDIPKIEELIEKNVPEVKYVIAHGKLSNKEINQIMNDFYDNKYDLIIATSIIQSGLDIPNANTIIITNSQNFGLSQIYQIRGRVGRSKLQSSAIITIPKYNISKTALQRLQVLQNLDRLGMGFVLATHDLDIRGAGNILGSKQSGHVKDVGVELFNKMLSDEVENIRNDHISDEQNDWSPIIKTNQSYYIPENYINDIKVRMGIYNRLADIKTSGDMISFEDELIDRFGIIPKSCKELINILLLKIRCKEMSISKLEMNSKGLNISFHDSFSYQNKLINWIEQNPKSASIRGNNLLFIKNIVNVENSTLGVINQLKIIDESVYN
jgi:transcription-repair coupling factor (superfamily II helicase)